MKQHNVIIDYGNQMISLTENNVEVPLYSVLNHPKFAITTSSICIPPYSEAIVSVSVPPSFSNQTVLLEPSPDFQFHKFAVARSISQCKKNKTSCKVLNYNSGALVLHKNKRIALVEKSNVIESCTPYNETEKEVMSTLLPRDKQKGSSLDKFHEEYGFQISSELRAQQKYQLLQLLWDYKTIFARSLEEIKKYPDYELNIELTSDRKIFKRQFRLNPQDAEEVERQIQTMYQGGIIEESDTVDWNSAIFLVSKKMEVKGLLST